MNVLSAFARALLPAALIACGGNVVVDKGGTGGAGTTTGSTSTITTTIHPVSCASHSDCGNGVCLFSTGTCADSCGFDLCEGCAQGTVCNDCATSSCPSCADCVSACMPIDPGRCDANDDCPAGQVCLYNSRLCAQACDSDIDCGGFSFCADCVTGSCCGCEDCVSACVGGE